MTNPTARKLQCPLCQCGQFDSEVGRMDSKWGLTSHKIVLLICKECRYILQFYDRNSIFDFD